MEMKTVQQRILIADKGKYLTDGETYGTTVVLPAEADYSLWKEVAQEELPKEEEEKDELQ